MKRIAAPMVGGMVSSTVLTLVVIPAVYSLWKEWEPRRAGADPPAPPPSRGEPAAEPELELAAAPCAAAEAGVDSNWVARRFHTA